MGANLISVNERELVLTLLPRATGKFNRYGLNVNKLRYYRDGYTEQYLNGGTVTVAYNPDDVTTIWLLEDGNYVEFTFIESRFQSKNLSQVEEIKNGHRAVIRASERDNLQAQIYLAQHIEAIADTANRGSNVRLKDIRSTRKKEQSKYHRNYMREGAGNE